MSSEFAVLDELPEAQRGGTQGKYVEELRKAQTEFAGKWCSVLRAKRVTSYVTAFKTSHAEEGAYSQVDIPNFQFASRKQVDDTEILYARYVPATKKKR
jgi:hypothetical protein